MKKIFILAITTFVLTSCNNDVNFDEKPVSAKITATIGDIIISRASDQSWEPNDSIGISSIVGGNEVPYFNVKYITKKGDGFFEGTPLYFYKPMTLTAYYPYNGKKDVPLGIDGIIEASTRPADQLPEYQSAIDFMWDYKTGITASHPNVDFTFTHKMSKITFVFQSSPELKDQTGKVIAGPVDVEDMINYKINELVLDGTFNTKTGLCSVKSDASPESLSIDVTDVIDNQAVLPIIVFPQSLSGGSTTLDIYTDELNDPDNLQHYKCNLSFSEGEILPGYHYKYTIKVSKIGLIVGKMTIEPWKESIRSMTATIDGEDVFKEKE